MMWRTPFDHRVPREVGADGRGESVRLPTSGGFDPLCAFHQDALSAGCKERKREKAARS